MHTRTLGQGLEVSAIGLGCAGMSQSYGPNPGDRDDMIAVLRYAVEEAGITFFDTSRTTAPSAPTRAPSRSAGSPTSRSSGWAST